MQIQVRWRWVWVRDTLVYGVLAAALVLLLFALIDWGVGKALGTYDGSQDHRTWGGGKGNPRQASPLK